MLSQAPGRIVGYRDLSRTFAVKPPLSFSFWSRGRVVSDETGTPQSACRSLDSCIGGFCINPGGSLAGMASVGINDV
jgi:hypothetical protein